MAAHTLGPWHVVPSSDGTNSQVRTGNGLFSFYQGSTGAPATEWAANARLIAAAPEMLETLLMVRESLRGFIDPPSARFIHEISWLNTAIAKAEGR